MPERWQNVRSSIPFRILAKRLWASPGSFADAEGVEDGAQNGLRRHLAGDVGKRRAGRLQAHAQKVVGDARGEIRYVSPGRRDVTTTFEVTEADLDELRAETADGERHLRWFSNQIVDAEGVLVAEVRKQVYIRKRPRD